MIMSKIKAIRPLLEKEKTLLDFDLTVDQETIDNIKETGTHYYNYNKDLKNKQTAQTQLFDIVYFSTTIPDLFYKANHNEFQNTIQTACDFLKPDGYLVFYNSNVGVFKARKNSIDTTILNKEKSYEHLYSKST